MNLTLLSQAELRRLKAFLATRNSNRSKKRLAAVLAELNSRFDHVPGVVQTISSAGYPIMARRCVETV